METRLTEGEWTWTQSYASGVEWRWTQRHECFRGDAIYTRGFRATANLVRDAARNVHVLVTVTWADPAIPPISEEYREVVCGSYEGTAESLTFAVLEVAEHAKRIIDLQRFSVLRQRAALVPLLYFVSEADAFQTMFSIQWYRRVVREDLAEAWRIRLCLTGVGPNRHYDVLRDGRLREVTPEELEAEIAVSSDAEEGEQP